jgi:predicted acyl esterase
VSPALRFASAVLIFATTFANSSASAILDSAYPPQYASIKTVQAWIPMKDGVRLAVNLYMPDGPLPTAHPGEKFPAILEYLPYRKDDWTLARDWDLHSYFVRRGYVTARVDIRGTGASVV